jgi:small redox-active disulfide protein 2
MEIKVLGAGCSRCHKTLEIVNKVVNENHVDANVEYVTDLMKIMEYNVMLMPAIVIDGVVRMKGTVPSESEVKQLLGV